MPTVTRLLDDIAEVGRDPGTGGYTRLAYDGPELVLREWFVGEAVRRGLDCQADRNGNLWAWQGDPDADGPGVVSGSHLDSVVDGGAYDGPLGVTSAFAALDLLSERGVRPARPFGIVAFADEEGARFGIACAGSRLLTGVLAPERARTLRDRGGTSMAEAMRAAGHDPSGIGRDDEALHRIGSYVELHIEQGRGLVDVGAPVGVGTAIWPHGRWRLTFTGAADHAGTTRMEDRRDPMLTYAMTALAANKQARLRGARATFGRLEVTPNGTNAIPSQVKAWLDARAADQATLDALVADVHRQAGERAGRDGTTLAVEAESLSPLVELPADLRDRIGRLLGDAPQLPTGAGHDAGILATAGVPAAMLFVRNPTGVSHAPAEHADDADCIAGVGALARVLADLLASPAP